MKPIPNLFQIPAGFTHRSIHAGGLSAFSTDYEKSLPLCSMGRKTWQCGDPHSQSHTIFGDILAKLHMICHSYMPEELEYSSIDKMVKYDRNMFCNYIAFLASDQGETRCPQHVSEWHEKFVPWDHYHNEIILFDHNSCISWTSLMI